MHTLTNLGPSPEPNITVLWHNDLPQAWKDYCAQQSIDTSSIQYENDLLMQEYFGDDYGIACCVSGMAIGQDMQFFGARANLAKLLLLAINGGKTEITHKGDESVKIIPELESLASSEKSLDFEQVWKQFVEVVSWACEHYVNMMNIIHYMHDKYHYESLQMGLLETQLRRFMAFGVAGFSVVADSLSAIKYSNVTPIFDKEGNVVDYKREGEYPAFGNDDNRVDGISKDIINLVIGELRKHKTYKEAEHSLSILTITSNVVYGKHTGATPDGRQAGEPFAPGANPMHGRDHKGALASLNSVAKLPYEQCLDGISNTFSIVPSSLGKKEQDKVSNLVALLDGYFVKQNGHHLNVNVLDREQLLDAQNHPEEYPQLTIRVSGYAVLFNKLTKEQQDEVISRTFHNKV